ncbi:MAG: 30S ribosomal protein S12 methylthiotransferase RimO [Candidatus Cloacimonadaceae bacterium]
MLYFLESLGCAKNLVDSEVFAQILESAGYQRTDLILEADLVLVNTCAFLEDALAEADAVLTTISEFLVGEKPRLLWVTGCLMNRVYEEFKGLFSEVDGWIGLKDFEGFRQLVAQTVANMPPAAAQSFHPRSRLTGTGFAYLRISDGCSNNCSYCTIPSIRGAHESVPIETLVEEARALAQDPQRKLKELILIAQDTALYGMDLYGRQALPELIEALHDIEEIQWIRVLYMHPDHFNLEWLQLWKRLPKLLPYFEIPIQHSVERILKAMGRKRAGDQLKEMFAHIKQELPTAILRTTLITGFPGETDEDFQELYAFVKEVGFNFLGVFEYSPEEGTPAYHMPDHVPDEIVVKRSSILINTHADQRTAFLERFVDQTLPVLIEEYDEENDGYLGRTWFFAPDIDGIVFVDAQDVEEGSIVNALITDADDTNLYAEYLETEGES